jgi:hypothetical protein
MFSSLARKFLILAIAVAFVAPPMMAVLNKALGGDGSHVHFDHAWHEIGARDDHHHKDGADHDDHETNPDADGADQAHNDHVHLAAVALAESFSLGLNTVPAAYEGLSPPLHFGRHSAPPGRPPQALS